MSEMRKAILDAFFVLDCMRKNVDFVSQLESEGFKVAVLRESLQEIRDWKRKPNTARSDKVLISEIESYLQDKGVEIKSRGSEKNSDWFMKRAKEGFYIGTKIKDVQHHIQKKIVLDHSKVRVVD